ncbi:MAG: potassium-transporting ATPase subunit KdpA, partial [Elusimicrobiaceae bacterium]
MINNDLVQVLLYIGCLVILTPPLGLYCARVLNGEKTFLTAFLGPLEKLFYRLSGINSCAESDWKGYAKDLLVFNAVGFGVLFLMQIFQNYLPLNPNHAGNISWHSAFNTAVSFVTNTNWQAYAGETAMSYLVQMAGLGVQNFVSAATGIAVFAALTRGIVRRQSGLLGNFWADTLRATLYILLPLSFVLALFLAGEGVIQNFSRNREIVTVESVSQTLPMGPAASQIAIKQLGTNGGGYFNANSAHPFENPTPLSNFLEMLAILLIPSALVYSYGVLTGAKKHAYVLYGIMLAVFLAGFGASLYCEHAAGRVAGVNLMEGKETRFGIVNSVLWSCATTAASSGSVNAMHSSLSPLSGGVALFNMMLGEIIFGGVGAGMYGMLLFVMLAVFLAGLMVGRTPEYMGKKIEKREIQMVITGVLAPSVAILAGTALACV